MKSGSPSVRIFSLLPIPVLERSGFAGWEVDCPSEAVPQSLPSGQNSKDQNWAQRCLAGVGGVAGEVPPLARGLGSGSFPQAGRQARA